MSKTQNCQVGFLKKRYTMDLEVFQRLPLFRNVDLDPAYAVKFVECTIEACPGDLPPATLIFPHLRWPHWARRDVFIAWGNKKIRGWNPVVGGDTGLCHDHLFKKSFSPTHSPFAWPAAGAASVNSPRPLDVRQRDISSQKEGGAGRFWTCPALRLQRSWGGAGGWKGRRCSKVVPLLPERLRTFMNRAFTRKFSPAGCLLCALYKSVSSHAATGDASRGRSFPLVAVGRIHPDSLLLLSHYLTLFSKQFHHCCRCALESFFLCFLNVGTAAAICVIM